MAVAQEFFDIFIRIADVDRVYPGGFDAYLKNYAGDVGQGIWHDDYLLREGAMSGGDVDQIVEHWRRLGLTPWREESGKPVEWLEVCVSSSLTGGPTLECSWIDFDAASHGAFLKGTDPGPLSWPNRRDCQGDDELVPF